MARQNARLAELATTDELTGVKNRRRFREDLELLFAQADRQASPLSLIMLDIDHFKQYNDAFGHPAGDEVLRRVGTTLQSAVRAHDVVARYGGEEFVVLLPATEANEALEVAERLRSAIADQPWPLRKVTASLGVATAGTRHAERRCAGGPGRPRPVPIQAGRPRPGHPLPRRCRRGRPDPLKPERVYESAWGGAERHDAA